MPKINFKNCEIGTISTTVDKWVKIVLYTPELSPEDMAELFASQKRGVADDIDVDYKQEWKSPGERMRNVLYVYWDFAMRKSYPVFMDFYTGWIEKKIDEVKALLPKL
jgi:hypothetical protein